MDPKVIRDAENARDLLGFKTYQQVFDKMAASPLGYITTGEWFLLFSASKNGFLMQLRNDSKIVIPVCPVLSCKDYTLGYHFCDEHCGGITFEKRFFADGTPNPKGIEMMISQICSDRNCKFGESSSSSGHDSLLESIERNPYINREVKVERESSSRSLKVTCHENKCCFNTCAHNAGCYNVGSMKYGVDYYCDIHYKKIQKKCGKDKLGNYEIADEMRTGIEILLKKANPGDDEIASNQLVADEVSGQDKQQVTEELEICCKQWKKFVLSCKDPNNLPTYTAGTGNVYRFKYDTDTKVFNYYSPAKRKIPLCLFPRCGRKVNKEQCKNGRFCTNKEHQAMEKKILQLLGENEN